MNKKPEIWFGCKDCKIEQKPDKKQSNKNWNVFPTGVKCPKCKKEMTIQMGDKPKL